MILVDADVLLALVDRAHPRHRPCVEVLRSLREPLATSWPVLSAAIAAARTTAPAAQGVILEMVSRGALRVLPLAGEDAPRLRDLVARRLRPLSLPQASLVHLAEREGIESVFSLGGEFPGRSLPGKGKRLRMLPVGRSKPDRPGGASRPERR